MNYGFYRDFAPVFDAGARRGEEKALRFRDAHYPLNMLDFFRGGSTWILCMGESAYEVKYERSLGHSRAFNIERCFEYFRVIL